jgi:hypothetical protein
MWDTLDRLHSLASKRQKAVRDSFYCLATNKKREAHGFASFYSQINQTDTYKTKSLLMLREKRGLHSFVEKSLSHSIDFNHFIVAGGFSNTP